MENNFVVKHRNTDKKGETHATITVRMEKGLLDQFENLAAQSGRSRNEVICMALQYAMDHLEFVSEPDEGTDPQ